MLDIQEEFLLLADGKRRQVENPKGKSASMFNPRGESHSVVAEKIRSSEKSQIVSFVKP